MLQKYLSIFLLVAGVATAYAGAGIQSITVFGDSLSDAGNIEILKTDHPNPSVLPQYIPPHHYGGRASNGPVWIEIVAAAYGYEVTPSLAGGSNFAYGGAESGVGLSDQETPNFLTQVAMWETAVTEKVLRRPIPWDLFVIWFGPNDFLRIMETEGRPVTPQDVQNSIQNIATGIVGLHQRGARMFLVPNMPPLHMTPFGLSQSEEVQTALAQLVLGFNTGLAMALDQIEADYPKVTIFRLDSEAIMLELIDNPEDYGLTNVYEPAYYQPGNIMLTDTPNEYLSWDGFHPTVAGHALIAQFAMDVIPIGSWWGHSMARGPHGLAWLEMGWVDDTDWPWFFSFSMNDEGTWLWALEEGGAPDGFLAYDPKGHKWVFINAMSGWYYDYESGSWMKMEVPEP
jgi:outer membrane lipase/esterase